MEIKQQYFMFGLVILAAIILLIAWHKLKQQTYKDRLKPSQSMFPKTEIINDKIIIIENIGEGDIKTILQDFCNMYNKEKYQAIPRLTELSHQSFAITFPYDINFEIFCYFVNYANYPMIIKNHFKAKGWATVKSSDTWAIEKIINKNVMLFTSDSDKEYDNVFLTSSNNIGLKFSFSINEGMKVLNFPEKTYEKPPIMIGDLNICQSITFN